MAVPRTRKGLMAVRRTRRGLMAVPRIRRHKAKAPMAAPQIRRKEGLAVLRTRRGHMAVPQEAQRLAAQGLPAAADSVVLPVAAWVGQWPRVVSRSLRK